MSGSAYIITGVGLAFTAVVIVIIWVKFFHRRTMLRLMQEAEAARMARELEAAQTTTTMTDDDEPYEQTPERPVVIKDAVVIEHPDGSTGFAYNTDDSDEEEGFIDGDAALRAKLRNAAAPRACSAELATVVVVGDGDREAANQPISDTVVVARENTFEWVGTGAQLPRPPQFVEEQPPGGVLDPPRRRWYHRILRSTPEEPPAASSARPVMTSTVLGAHDAAAHPMALAFSFGG